MMDKNKISVTKVGENVDERKFHDLSLKVIGIVVIWTIFLAIYFNYQLFDSPLKPNEIGQIGDYYGGLLNPVFAFFTIVLLVWSIRMQMKELKLATEEMSNTAKAQKEIAEQGYANFYIEQSLKAIEMSQSRIDKLKRVYLHVNNEFDENNNLYRVAEVAGNQLTIGAHKDFIDRNEVFKVGNNKTSPKENLSKYIIAIESQVVQQLENLVILLENRAWSLVAYFLEELIGNIEMLWLFELSPEGKAGIENGFEKAYISITKEYAIMRKEKERATTFGIVGYSYTKIHDLHKAIYL